MRLEPPHETAWALRSWFWYGCGAWPLRAQRPSDGAVALATAIALPTLAAAQQPLPRNWGFATAHCCRRPAGQCLRRSGLRYHGRPARDYKIGSFGALRALPAGTVGPAPNLVSLRRRITIIARAARDRICARAQQCDDRAGISRSRCHFWHPCRRPCEGTFGDIPAASAGA